MVQKISKGFYVKDSELSHVVCDLGNNENDTDKYPKIIEDYETEKKLFTAEYIFFRKKVREKKYQSYCQQQGMTFKKNEARKGRTQKPI